MESNWRNEVDMMVFNDSEVSYVWTYLLLVPEKCELERTVLLSELP